MATEEELNNQKELNRLKREQKLIDSENLDLSASLVDSIKEVLGINTKRTTSDANLLKVNRQINSQILNQKTGLTSISELNKAISKNQDIINRGLIQTNSLEKTLSDKSLKKVNIATKAFTVAQNAQLELEKALITTNEQGELDREAIEKAIAKEARASAIAEKQMESVGNLEKQLIFTRLNTAELEKQNEKRKEELELENQITDRLGLAGNLLKGLPKLMDKLGLGALASAAGFSDIGTEIDEFARTQQDFGDGIERLPNAQENFQKSIELTGKALQTSLSDPFILLSLSLKGLSALFTPIKDAIFAIDEGTSKLARNLNLSRQDAAGLRKELSAAAGNSGNLFVTTGGLQESLVEINQTLGTNARISDENLTTFTELKKQAGFTAEELQGINSLSIANNKTLEDTTGEFLAQVKLTNASLKTNLNEKEILKDINQVSAAITLSLGKNPGLIAEAVTTSKAFGLELSKVDAIANSLLDFESSIQSELEAELLLGKNINLEKARQAALDNDLATVAREIASQTGSAAEFGEMNRIQQEAIAKSVGLNREELAQSLFLQEQIGNLKGDDAALTENLVNKLQKQGLSQDEIRAKVQATSLDTLRNQASVQEKFAAAGEKLNEAFINIGNALLPLVEGVATFFGFISESKIALIAISGLIVGLVGALSALAAKATILAIKSAATAVSSIFTGAASLGPFGIPLAIGGVAALTGAIASAVALADDVAIPSGYGKRMILGPEGSIALNNKDTIVAGTDLFKADDMTLSPEGTNTVVNNQNTTIDNTALVTKMDQLIAVNERILAKSSVIEMNGNQVGQEINTSERAIQ